MSACLSFGEKALQSAGRVALLGLCCILLAQCGFRRSRILAEQGVKEFHAYLDSGRYETIYSQSGDSLKKAMSQADFVAYLRDIHFRLGNTQRTTTNGFSEIASPGQGTEVALVTETQFDRGVAQERFLWRVTGGGVVLLDYRADIERSTGPRTV
jgi:hypothetical protein